MSQKLGVVLAICLSAVVSSHADAKARLLAKVESSLKGKGPKKAAVKNLCANFKGSWTGSCTYADGRVEHEEVSIDQYDCASVSIAYDAAYTEDLLVGGSNREGSTDFVTGANSDDLTTTDWTDGYQTLLSRYSSQNRDTSDNSVYQVNGFGTLKLVDGKLISHAEGTIGGSIGGHPEDGKIVEDCTYERASTP